MDEYVTSLVKAAVSVIGRVECIIKEGVNISKKSVEFTILANEAKKAFNEEGYFGPQTAKHAIPVLNFFFVNNICLNVAISLLHTKMFIDVSKYELHIEICVKIISIIFDKKDITAMMGYLKTYEIDQITPTIATKIDKLLETAEQIVELITIDSDAPVDIKLPPCLSKEIENKGCGKNIQNSIEKCSKSLREESNRQNPETRKALFSVINEYKQDPSKSDKENKEKRMKLILVIAFILKLYYDMKEPDESQKTYDEYTNLAYLGNPGGNRNKSRRDKSRRVKSRRVKSRRVKSRRVKSRRVKSRRNRK